MSEEIQDEWQRALAVKKDELEACQVQQNVQSCLTCAKLLECDIRDSYIKSVYDSMSKGQGGGFEF